MKSIINNFYILTKKKFFFKSAIGCFNGEYACVNWEDTEVYNLFQECPRQNKEKREVKKKEGQCYVV